MTKAIEEVAPMLTAGQLIQLLSQCPPDLPVEHLCPDGYSDGVTGVSIDLDISPFSQPHVELKGYGRHGTLKLQGR